MVSVHGHAEGIPRRQIGAEQRRVGRVGDIDGQQALPRHREVDQIPVHRDTVGVAEIVEVPEQHRLRGIREVDDLKPGGVVGDVGEIAVYRHPQGVSRGREGALQGGCEWKKAERSRGGIPVRGGVQGVFVCPGGEILGEGPGKPGGREEEGDKQCYEWGCLSDD